MKKTLIIVNDIDNLLSYTNWDDVELVIFINAGQPNYFKLKGKVQSIVKDTHMSDIITFVSFPVPTLTSITPCLLYGIGRLFSSNVEVIDGEYKKFPEDCFAGPCLERNVVS